MKLKETIKRPVNFNLFLLSAIAVGFIIIAFGAMAELEFCSNIIENWLFLYGIIFYVCRYIWSFEYIISCVILINLFIMLTAFIARIIYSVENKKRLKIYRKLVVMNYVIMLIFLISFTIPIFLSVIFFMILPNIITLILGLALIFIFIIVFKAIIDGIKNTLSEEILK